MDEFGPTARREERRELNLGPSEEASDENIIESIVEALKVSSVDLSLLLAPSTGSTKLNSTKC